MPRTLKVYSTSAGFYDAVVAAPSQKAALEAWGAGSNLFAAGEAKVVEDAALIAKALARPGEVLRKPRGDAAALVAAAKRDVPKPASRAAKPSPALKLPDHAAVDAAETAFAKAEARHGAQMARLAKAREEAQTRENEARVAGEARLANLRSRRDAAWRAYEAAGGKI